MMYGRALKWMRSGRRLLAISAIFGLAQLSITEGARAEPYLLQRGDVLELTVVGFADLHQQIPIDVDGNAMFPLVGAVPAVGRTIDEINTTIKAQLPLHGIVIPGTTGGATISPPADSVSVNIAQYHPVYVSGDVSHPGEQPYRPSLTVRQAIVLAGDYDIGRFRMTDPSLQLVDLQQDYTTLWTDYAAAQERVGRLRAQLDGDAVIPPLDTSNQPLGGTVVGQIRATEQQSLDLVRASEADQNTHLQATEKLIQSQIDLLKQKHDAEEEGYKADKASYAALQAALAKGSVVASRVDEARRALLFSSTQMLQTEAELSRAQQAIADLGSQLRESQTKSRQAALEQLQAATVTLSELTARIQATNEKIYTVGILRSRLTGPSRAPVITISRAGSSEKMTVTEDSELMPGDVINVSLSGDLLPSPEVDQPAVAADK